MGPVVGTIPKFKLHISRHCQIQPRLIYRKILYPINLIYLILCFILFFKLYIFLNKYTLISGGIFLAGMAVSNFVLSKILVAGVCGVKGSQIW